MAVFYLRIRGKEYGPLASERLRQLVAAGKLTSEDEVSTDRTKWVKAKNVHGLFPPPPEIAAIPPIPPQIQSATRPRATRRTRYAVVSILAVVLIFGSVAAIGLRRQPAAAHVSPDSQAAPAQAEAEPAGIRSPQQLDAAEISIVQASVERVGIREPTGEITVSDNELLRVVIKIENTSTTAKIDYQTFNPRLDAGDSLATATDQHGNNYRRATFGLANPLNRTTEASIYPGKSIRDVLIFEAPIEGIEYVQIELLGERIGQSGKAVFRIPSADIKRPE